MTRAAIAAVALLVAAPLAPLEAQRARLLESVHDGFTAPRVVHHAARVAGGVGAYAGLRAVHAPRPLAAGVGAFLSGVLPHVVGLVTGTARPFNGPDWIADAHIAGGPALVAGACGRRVASYRCVGAAALWLGGYVAASRVSSP